jgi:U4/U6 small nuclear ribonucleoprotein PRP3
MAAFNQKNAAGSAAQQQQPVAPVPSRPVTSLPQPPQQAPSPLINADIAARIAAAKARIDSLKANSVLPPASSASTGASPRPTSTVGEGRTTGSAPLGIHPSLLENASTPSAVASSSKDRNRTMAPKFSSLKVSYHDHLFRRFKKMPELTSSLLAFQANARNASSGPPSAVGSPASTDPATRVNPYLAAAAASSTEEDGGITAKARSSRKFHFNQKGKYVAQAEQLRADVRSFSSPSLRSAVGDERADASTCATVFVGQYGSSQATNRRERPKGRTRQ